MLERRTLFRQLFAIGCLLAALATSATSDAATIRAMANNNFVTATAAGTSFLTATASVASTWEQYQIINNANGTISLQATISGNFVSADIGLPAPNTDQLISNRPVASTWEQFTIVPQANGTVALQALANNLFVSADLNLGGDLIANRTIAQAWEQFIIEDNGGGTGPCADVSNITVNGTTYVPQWCQEFDGSAGPPDTTVFTFDLGNNNGWGNGEVEVYCGPPGYPNNPSQCPTSFSTTTAPVYIDGSGHLVIQPRNVNGTWLSGRLNTAGKHNFQYGILEASIQLPNTTNPGLWPAFWSLGSNITTVPWPACGEADIMENWSPQVLNGAGPSGNNSTIHTAETGGSGVGRRFTFPSGQAANTAFHTYGVIWTPNEMQYFVDNASTSFFTATPGSLPAGDTWPFNQPIFLLTNVAVGGTLGGSTSGLTNPGPMKIDFIRWYTAQ